MHMPKQHGSDIKEAEDGEYMSKQHGTDIQGADFSWALGNTFTLRNIQLKLPTESGDGRLVAVVGPVGCGKSSLLSAVMGEMKSLRHRALLLPPRASYVAQSPWLQNLSVRSNILFGRDFDQDLYDTVIDASQLSADLASLPLGDAANVGENGANLSGGQRQRVALARALYQLHSYDLYLMDAPLSSLDTGIRRAIFEKVAIDGFLKLTSTLRFQALGRHSMLNMKTRIFTSSSLEFLESDAVDEILYMEGAYNVYLPLLLVSIQMGK
jgi:ABC-type transport system involved in cytochrome bd biosynthesis fused ATPase/permease subunit